MQTIQQKKLPRVAALAKSRMVELMTHPIVREELDYIMSEEFKAVLQDIDLSCAFV